MRKLASAISARSPVFITGRGTWGSETSQYPEEKKTSRLLGDEFPK